MALKSRNTFNPRQRRTTRARWIYGMGKFTALGFCAFPKKPAYLTLLPTPNRYAQDHPGADPYDLETLKDFVRDVTYGIDGVTATPKAGKKASSNTGKTSQPDGGGTTPPYLPQRHSPLQMLVPIGFILPSATIIETDHRIVHQGTPANRTGPRSQKEDPELRYHQPLHPSRNPVVGERLADLR